MVSNVSRNFIDELDNKSRVQVKSRARSNPHRCLHAGLHRQRFETMKSISGVEMLLKIFYGASTRTGEYGACDHGTMPLPTVLCKLGGPFTSTW